MANSYFILGWNERIRTSDILTPYAALMLNDHVPRLRIDVISQKPSNLLILQILIASWCGKK